MAKEALFKKATADSHEAAPAAEPEPTSHEPIAIPVVELPNTPTGSIAVLPSTPTEIIAVCIDGPCTSHHRLSHI